MNTQNFNQDKFQGLRYAGITYDDMANGEGVGAVLFTQYCPHHCFQCHNQHTWDKDGGKEFTEEVFNRLISYYETVPFASRLTLSGGDPLANLELSTLVAKTFRRKFPQKKIWVYTGYRLEEVWNEKYLPVLRLTNVLVDGRFEFEKRDVSLMFRGSKNQRLIDMQETIRTGKVTLWKAGKRIDE